MALIPHLRKNKGVALGMTLEVFQFVADTLPPGPKWALPGTAAFTVGGPPPQQPRQQSASAGSGLPLHSSCSPWVRSVFP